MQVTVIGAGVVGLTTALILEQRGHAVRVVAAQPGTATTSSVAGAVWFPYQAGPRHEVSRWAARTRSWLEEIARSQPHAGVDALTAYEITATDEHPWWASEGGLQVERRPAPVRGEPLAWRFAAPRAEPALFLPYLRSRLRAEVEHRAVSDLAQEPGDVVVNCAGLGAAQLANDASMVGLYGQVVITDAGSVSLGTTITDDRSPDEIFYVIPRRGELVLGGCCLPRSLDDALVVDPAITARILEQARALGLGVGAVRGVRAGLRPYRADVRLERDLSQPRVVHNYGHGGAGFTLCYGCAQDVADLIEA